MKSRQVIIIYTMRLRSTPQSVLIVVLVNCENTPTVFIYVKTSFLIYMTFTFLKNSINDPNSMKFIASVFLIYM